MNDLNLHITRLLLEHNCVIVPDLGGFVTQYCPAHYDEVAGEWVAPSFQVGFNPLLQADDGLLAQSFMMANQTSYDEAVHDIRLCVHQLRETIRTRKEATLISIGTFRLSRSGAYDFTPVQGGIDAPSLFGLSALPLQKLQKTKTPVTDVAQLHATKDSYTLHISKSMLRHVAAAAVAVVFYFVWAAPLNRPVASNQANEAQMFEQVTQLLSNVTASQQQKDEYQQTFKLSSSTSESISAEELMQGGVEKSQAAAENKDVPTAAAPRAVQSKVKYSLVVASQVPLSGAKELVQRLHKEGLSEARIMQHHKMVRVVVGSYAHYEDARKALKEQRKVSGFFADSWVLKEEPTSEEVDTHRL